MIKRFLEYTNNELRNPHYMIIGNSYRITEPVFDDYDEGLTPEINNVEVISKNRSGFIVRNIDIDDTYQIDFKYLMDCTIEEINQ